MNGKRPGEEIHWKGTKLEVGVEVRAVSQVSMDSLELVVNGKTVAEEKAEANGRTVHLVKSMSVRDSCWIAGRVRGRAHRLVPNDVAVYAHTSPVYCYRSGRSIASPEDAIYFVEQIDQLIQRVKEKGVFDKTFQKEEMIRLFREGQDVYRRIAAKSEKEAALVQAEKSEHLR